MALELSVPTDYEVAACKLLEMNATQKWRGYQIGHRDIGYNYKSQQLHTSLHFIQEAQFICPVISCFATAVL